MNKKYSSSRIWNEPQIGLTYFYFFWLFYLETEIVIYCVINDILVWSEII